MDNQRLILFVALSIIIVMLWSAWETEQRKQAPAPAVKTEQVPSAPSTPSTPAAPAAQTAVVASATPQVNGALLVSGERIEVTTDLLQAVIDTQGGDLRQLFLRKHPVSIKEPNSPFRLLDDQGKRLLVAQSGLIAREGTLPNHKSRYRAEGKHYVLADGQDSLQVRLHWDGPDDLRVSKTYTFHRNDYRVDVAYELTNGGRKPREAFLYGQWLSTHVDEGRSLMALPSYTGGVIYSADKKYEKVSFDDMSKKALAREVDGGWVAMLQHYFVGAWLPDEKQRHQFYTDTHGDNYFFLGYKTLAPVVVAPGGKATLGTRLYAGPKDQHRLEKTAPGLELTVDYGMLTFIAAPLFWILEWLHKVVGNWGWSIILLTLLIKLVFYPLSVASYRSMAHMRKVQPRLQAIKERYGDDKQKLHQAMMEIYKTEKINPLGGCLPILVQIPVFIALYWVLLESVELRQAPWALWIKDLAEPDPYFVLPVLMGGSMLVQQWLNPQPLEDFQKKLMYALPVVFTFMFLWFPSGLVLYWVVQNVLSIAQQWQINRTIVGKH
jgi:YidC/Oxa1 family membrane protein insertase